MSWFAVKKLVIGSADFSRLNDSLFSVLLDNVVRRFRCFRLTHESPTRELHFKNVRIKRDIDCPLSNCRLEGLGYLAICRKNAVVPGSGYPPVVIVLAVIHVHLITHMTI